MTDEQLRALTLAARTEHSALMQLIRAHLIVTDGHIESALGQVGACHEPSPDWQERIFAIIDANKEGE